MNVARAELSDNKDEQEIQVHNMQASLATIMSKLNAAQQDAKTRYQETYVLELSSLISSRKWRKIVTT